MRCRVSLMQPAAAPRPLLSRRARVLRSVRPPFAAQLCNSFETGTRTRSSDINAECRRAAHCRAARGENTGGLMRLVPAVRQRQCATPWGPGKLFAQVGAGRAEGAPARAVPWRGANANSWRAGGLAHAAGPRERGGGNGGGQGRAFFWPGRRRAAGTRAQPYGWAQCGAAVCGAACKRCGRALRAAGQGGGCATAAGREGAAVGCARGYVCAGRWALGGNSAPGRPPARAGCHAELRGRPRAGGRLVLCAWAQGAQQAACERHHACPRGSTTRQRRLRRRQGIQVVKHGVTRGARASEE